MTTNVGCYAAILAALLLVIGTPADAHNAGHDSTTWERLAADEPASAFTLTNQDGKRMSLLDFRGKPLVMTFTYTHCTDACPLLVQSLVFAEHKLTPAEREQVRFVAISVDPTRDTPAHLKAYMKTRGLDARHWSFLTGNLKEATQVASDYGVVVHPSPHGDFVHNSVFVVIDAEGRERAEFHGLATPVEAIVGEVRGLIKHVTAQK